MVKGAFDGVTVLDFTQGVAGPHASLLLALHGADVIKIEPPEGDWGRALGELKGDHCAHSIAFNRGKRSIALDLKSPDGIAVVKKIAAKADVVKSKNGHITLSAMRPHHFKLLFELIGRLDIANDPELQSHNDRIRNAPKIIKALQETMPSKTTEEWIAILQPKDVFCERVNNYTDYLEHPHVKESGAVDWIEQEGVGRLPVAHIPGLPPASH